MGFYRVDQCLRVGGTESVIDVEAIGRATYGNHLGTEFMKHHRRDLVGRAVRTVHNNFHAFERQIVGKCAFAKFDVTPCRIVKAARFSQ